MASADDPDESAAIGRAKVTLGLPLFSPAGTMHSGGSGVVSQRRAHGHAQPRTDDSLVDAPIRQPRSLVSEASLSSSAEKPSPRPQDEDCPSGRESDPEQGSSAHPPQDEAPTIATSSTSEDFKSSKHRSSTASEQGDADSPPDLQSRLRTLASSLPAFDALTSSASLSSAVSAASQRTRTLASDMRSRLSTLAAQYNTYSGYAAIESLKQQITLLESDLDTKRLLAAQAKRDYLDSVQSRSASQRETNDLLSRKASWTETDLSRYTQLLRAEHTMTKHEAEAEKTLEQTEAEVQKAFDSMMKAVMVRYHEEQLWSDRMRGMSTYGSLIVAGLNAFLFILAILLVEPYKRKKLAQTFESRLVAAEHESRQLILASVERFQHSLDTALTPPPPALEPDNGPVETLPPAEVEVEGEYEAACQIRTRKHQEERLVFASTVGVVVGAALSLLIGACWT
ncbi:mitochondrial distribution and morphology family 33 [Moesziomyces antarcticus]|uniref:Sensitive to high expression protein 9, mitochondrial n=1 Tax=Pseudozyma antarctica TaxID=84753 RepID=A0A081CMR4_PSEA2|nr:mitochondrial distribution and morphology family 33 [Moesziomyces antarcticus]GAK67960.1 mitochondrial distribution and morphology family 33 [Moesziomyces antarcticus]